MPSKNQNLGKIGERLATNILLKKGFKIISHNFFCRFGELDIIAQTSKGKIIFVEVKTLTSESLLKIEQCLTKRKILRINKTILLWLNKFHYSFTDWRLDYIGLVIQRNTDNILKFQYFENIIENA